MILYEIFLKTRRLGVILNLAILNLSQTSKGFEGYCSARFDTLCGEIMLEAFRVNKPRLSSKNSTGKVNLHEMIPREMPAQIKHPLAKLPSSDDT